MRARGFIGVFVLEVTLLVIGILVISSSVIKRNSHIRTNQSLQNISSIRATIPTPQVPDSATPIPDIYGLESPMFSSDLSWSLVPKEKQELSNPTLRWYTIKPRFAGDGKIVLSGKEFVALETIESRGQKESIWEFRDTLLEQGWSSGSEGLKLDNYSVRVIGGGGEPPANFLFMGYMKDENEKVRVVNFSVDEPDSPGEGALEIKYPYEVQYHIFISDIITREALLQQIEHEKSIE